MLPEKNMIRFIQKVVKMSQSDIIDTLAYWEEKKGIKS